MTLADITATVLRSGDPLARQGVALVVDAFPAAVAELLLTEGDADGRKAAASLSGRIRRLIEGRAGSITHRHLIRYIAEVLCEPEHLVRDRVLEDVAAGVYELTWADLDDNLRHTLRISR